MSDLKSVTSIPLPEDEDSALLLLPGKITTRLLAEAADIFLAFILGVTLFGVAFSPLFGYNTLSNEMLSLSKSMITEETSAHLLLLDPSSNSYSTDDMKSFWIKGYFDGNTTDSAGICSDFVFDYYTLYRKEKLFSVADYNTKILALPATLSEANSSPYFAYDTSKSDPLGSLAVLKEDAHQELQDYYDGKKTAESLSLYQNLSLFFDGIYSNAMKEFVQSEPYRGLLLSYASLVHKRARLASAAAFTSYLVTGGIFFLVIPLIKKKGTTFGKKIMKLQVASPDGSLKLWQIFSRGAVELVEYIFLVPFEGLLLYGFDSLTLPLFSIGSFSTTLSVLLVAGLLITLVSLLLMIFTKTHQSLHDFSSKSFVFTSDYAIIDSERAKRAQEEKEKHGNDE
jgi:uncharacterized RDD family membrane protein YckC